MEVQRAPAMNSGHVNIHRPPPPMTRDKGKRKVCECNVEPNYISHQQTAVSEPSNTSNDTLQDFLCMVHLLPFINDVLSFPKNNALR